MAKLNSSVRKSMMAANQLVEEITILMAKAQMVHDEHSVNTLLDVLWAMHEAQEQLARAYVYADAYESDLETAEVTFNEMPF